MNFQEAVKAMNEGKNVKREKWKDHQNLFLNTFTSDKRMEVTFNNGSKGFPHIPVNFFCIQVYGQCSVWHPCQEDMKAEDWEIIENG